MARADTQSTKDESGPQNDRLLPWIAAERAVRALVLIGIGLVLVSHVHTDWGRTITDAARHVGFDPTDNGIRRLSGAASKLSPDKLAVYGAIAIAYGALEGCEGYGLFRRRRWGEWLTVVATTLLFIPEIDGLVKKLTPFRVGALALNVVIVVYLLYRLRKHAG